MCSLPRRARRARWRHPRFCPRVPRALPTLRPRWVPRWVPGPCRAVPQDGYGSSCLTQLALAAAKCGSGRAEPAPIRQPAACLPLWDPPAAPAAPTQLPLCPGDGLERPVSLSWTPSCSQHPPRGRAPKGRAALHAQARSSPAWPPLSHTRGCARSLQPQHPPRFQLGHSLPRGAFLTGQPGFTAPQNGLWQKGLEAHPTLPRAWTPPALPGHPKPLQPGLEQLWDGAAPASLSSLCQCHQPHREGFVPHTSPKPTCSQVPASTSLQTAAPVRTSQALARPGSLHPCLCKPGASAAAVTCFPLTCLSEPKTGSSGCQRGVGSGQVLASPGSTFQLPQHLGHAWHGHPRQRRAHLAPAGCTGAHLPQESGAPDRLPRTAGAAEGHSPGSARLLAQVVPVQQHHLPTNMSRVPQTPLGSVCPFISENDPETPPGMLPVPGELLLMHLIANED